MRAITDLTTAALTDVGSAAIATADGPAHHGAAAKRSVTSHAYASTPMQLREIAVAHASASGDSRDDEKESEPEDPEESESDGLSILLTSVIHWRPQPWPRAARAAYAEHAGQ